MLLTQKSLTTAKLRVAISLQLVLLYLILFAKFFSEEIVSILSITGQLGLILDQLSLILDSSPTDKLSPKYLQQILHQRYLDSSKVI